MAGNWWSSIILILIVALSSIGFHAQQDTNYYRITFSDKLNTPFTIQQPEGFLSEGAIARRENQGIPIIENDLPIDPNYIAQILTYNSVDYITHSKWFNQVVVISDDTNDINSIVALPFVANSEQFLPPIHQSKSTHQKLMIEAPKSEILVNPHYPYGKTYPQNHLHNLDYMHDLSFNGQGVNIAVIDAGFENANTLIGLSHLFESGQILSTYDFVAKEESVTEDHYHGSAVLSVMAGYIEGEYYGAAVGANYHLLRSEDAAAEYIIEEDFWVRAAEYADSAGCDIINTSLGYSTFDDSTQNHTYEDLDGNTTLIARGSDMASSKGILCVTSAGNLGDSDWGYISTPGDADSSITVGAIDPEFDQLASFSSFGPSADGDIKPNLVSVGWMTQLIAPWDNEIIEGNGTSFSAPLLAGIAACLWQSLPDMTNMEIKSLLEDNASQSDSPDTLKGYGYPNIFNAYSSITGISYQSPVALEIQNVYPNPTPAGSAIQLKIASTEDMTVTLICFDMLGKICVQRDFDLTIGVNLVTLPNDLLVGTGIYQIVVQNEEQIDLGRIILH